MLDVLQRGLYLPVRNLEMSHQTLNYAQATEHLPDNTIRETGFL
jgi:hypothetical protein